MTGRLLAGRYELRGVLGRGGMAEVRDGWDTRLNRPVAVKLLYPVFTERPDLRRRFADEARAAGSLPHPHIVAVYDSGEHDGAPFIVMERLAGDTFGDVMAAGPMDPQRVRAVLDQVLSALHAAHGAGVLHRDIKPANILLSPTGVKVADFGIAKTRGSAPTTTGQLVGTLSYLSPQRVLGAPASAADDLYAVGLVGYEALIGAPAYPQDNTAALARAITDDPLPTVTTLRANVDPVLAGVIGRALTHDTDQRFTSAAQMRAALAGDRAALAIPRPATKVLDQSPSLIAPLAPSQPEKRSRKSRYGFIAAIAIAFAVAAVALAMGPFSSTPATEPTGTSTSAVPPPSPSTTVPTSTATPVTLAPEPPPQDKKPKEGKPGRGNGNGNGNGKRD